MSSESEQLTHSCLGGCPQRWAIAEGYGCSLLQKPELIADMVKQTKSRANLPVSIKIRVDPDLRFYLL